MAENWKKLTIGEICNSISDTYHSNNGEVILVNTSDVFDGKILNHLLVENKSLKGQFKKTFQKDDILFSEIRPANKRYAYIDFENTAPYIASTKLMVLRAKTNIIRPRFLFAFLSSQQVLLELQHLAETRSGTFPQITFSSELAPMQILVPNLETQDKIVKFLSSINEKIRNNEKINENLLQQALCLYNELVNDKTKNGCIGDYCIVKSGFAFKSQWWQKTGVPVIKIGSINQDSLNLSDCSFVSNDKVKLASDFIVAGGDLVIAMTGATIGKFTMVPETAETILVNQRVGKFFLGSSPVKRIPFMYCTLKQPDVISEVINRGQGSAQPNISASDIMSIPCAIPLSEEIDNFNKQTSSLFKIIISNQFENLKLANVRDLILPKLMSGELGVSDLDL